MQNKKVIAYSNSYQITQPKNTFSYYLQNNINLFFQLILSLEQVDITIMFESNSSTFTDNSSCSSI